MNRPFSLLLALGALVFALPVSAHEDEEEHTHIPPEPAVDVEVEVEPAQPAPEQPVPAEAAPAETAPEQAPAAAAAPAARDVDEPPPERRHTSIPDTDWRQSARTRSARDRDKVFQPRHFLFEMRFGAYSPEVDEEFDGAATPYADFFGTSPQFYFGLELDWLPLNVPYVGSVGLAGGWGYTAASGNTKVVAEEGGAEEEAGSETGLTIFPMHVSAVLRLDALLRHDIIPLVPYAKLGFGFGVWRATGPDGTAQAVDPATGASVSGSGISTGWHLAVGGSLALNAFDRATAMAMYEETGIRYAHIWGEWMWANLDGFGEGDAMHVGTSTGVAGLGIEW